MDEQKLCDCGKPIDTSQPEYREERDLFGKMRLYPCEPTKCRDCRNKFFWRSYEAKTRRTEG